MLSHAPSRGADTSTRSNLNDLDRLLSRLEKNVLSEDADSELRHSVYLRRKTGANVEYARTLLLRLEQDVSTIKVASQRQVLAANLASKRDTIKQLNRYLIELDQLDTSSDEDEANVPSPNPSVALQAVSTPSAAPNGHGADSKTTGTIPEATSTLRSRKPGAVDINPSAASTTALFSGRPSTPPTALQTREQLLSSSAAEQEALKSSLLSLATQLKASNLTFSQSLEEEKSVLDRAVSGLDKNALGMEGAERKMGTLRKMTEGQGWWGRIKLYAIIGVLWLAAFLLVFVGPKLRF